MSKNSKYLNSLTVEQHTALNCIYIAQRLIIRNGDTEHNIAIRSVIREIADTYKVNPEDSYKLLYDTLSNAKELQNELKDELKNLKT